MPTRATYTPTNATGGNIPTFVGTSEPVTGTLADEELLAAGEVPGMRIYAYADAVLTQIGTSNDGRVFQSFTHRELPLPFYLMATKGHGDPDTSGNPVAGEITAIWQDGNDFRGTIAYYDTVDGRLAASLAKSGSIRFVSVDPGAYEAEWVEDNAETMEGHWEFSEYEIGAATQVGVPAFPRAIIDRDSVRFPGETDAMVAAAEADFHIMKRADLEFIPEALTASFGRDVTAEAFHIPEPADPMRYENDLVVGSDVARPFIESDGVTWHGYLAHWGTCHVGYQGQCKTPPVDDDFHFFQRLVLGLDDGAERGVGHVTLDTGHAQHRIPAKAALSHYDDTGARVAYAEYVNGTYGIWGRGVMNPAATDVQLEHFHRSPQSGDWRGVGPGGALRLIASLVVNYPGFPIPDLAMGANDNGVTVLTAAGDIPDEAPVPASAPAMSATADRLARQIGVPTAAELAQSTQADLARRVGGRPRRMRRRS